MSKLKRIVSIGLLTATAAIGVPHWLTQETIAQTISGQQLSWWEIFQNDPPVDEKAGGPRPLRFNFCGITPRSVNTQTEVWSVRPLFVWQGNLGKIEVRTGDRQKVLWTQVVEPTDNRVTYTGEALQPGQTYSWMVFDQRNTQLMSIPFKIMDSQDRERIEADLMSIEEELKEKSAAPEEIANARANYFAQNLLWSDVLQEVYSLDNPSEDLKEIIQQIPPQLCSPQRQTQG